MEETHEWACLFCEKVLRTNNAGRHYGVHKDAGDHPASVVVTIEPVPKGFIYVIRREDKDLAVTEVAAPRNVSTTIETARRRAEIWLSQFGEFDMGPMNSRMEVAGSWPVPKDMSPRQRRQAMEARKDERLDEARQRYVSAQMTPAEALSKMAGPGAKIPIEMVGRVTAWIEDTTRLVEELR